MLSLYELYHPLEVLAVALAPTLLIAGGFVCLGASAFSMLYLILPFKSEERLIDYVAPPVLLICAYVLFVNGVSFSVKG